VTPFGDARNYGSVVNPGAPMIGIVADPTGGYYVFGDDGSIYSFGGAQYYGAPNRAGELLQPIVAMTVMPTGEGYRLMASDGGIFTYGDATYAGSAGGTARDSPMVGMASTPDGHGYWMTTADGTVYAFGDAVDTTGPDPQGHDLHGYQAVGMASTPSGYGYWLVDYGANVYASGNARTYPFTGG
jgi:hypothetical protein